MNGTFIANNIQIEDYNSGIENIIDIRNKLFSHNQ